jgi:signal transduction histidine kinase
MTQNPTSTPTLSEHLASILTGRSSEIARRWVRTLEERLAVEPKRVVPSDALLNHIPKILDHVAPHVPNPDGDVEEAWVVNDLRRLAELRRSQGYGLREVLEEFELLSELVRDVVEQATRRFEGQASPAEAMAVVARVHTGLTALSTITADFYRVRLRQERESRAEILSSFGRVLAHEMKNRLGSGQAAARTLVDPSIQLSQEDVDRYHAVIERSISSTLKAVDDVRALATIQRGDAGIEGRNVPLESVVDDVLNDLLDVARARDVTLRKVGDYPYVTVPASLLQIALVNLVGNGIKYSDPEEGSRLVEVGVEAVDGHDACTVFVRDNGVGIPPDLHDRIFAEFERGDESEDGMGLGLAIVHRAVDRLDGRIRVESEAGVGSTFYLTLPAEGGGSGEGREE